MNNETPTPGEYFKNRKQAHNWLKENGYHVAIGKFYKDIEENGFPVVNADKTVSRYQVAEYGLRLNAESRPDLSALERSEYLHRKEKAEAEMAEIKAEKMRREFDDNWFHRVEAWSAIAALLGDLQESLRRGFHTAQRPLVETAAGELSRAPEVYEELVSITDAVFNEVQRKAIDIQWQEDEND